MSEKVTVEDLNRLVEELQKQRLEKEKQEDILKAINKCVDALENKCAAYLKELDQDSFKTPYGTIYRIQRWRVPTPKSDTDKKAFFDYLQEKGMFYTLASVNSNSLNSFYKNEVEAAKERGEFLEIPGLEPPQLTETLGVRKK